MSVDARKISKINDLELEEIIFKRLSSSKNKLLVVGTGITSSHLGDERNLREFFIANFVVKHLRNEGNNVLFYLFDDSYDPLNFRQLRVAVNKDEKLIKKFEQYCGMPIKLIPDPYECHPNYSAHFQDEILKRFRKYEIYPNIIDTYNSYESGLYNNAKEVVFKNYQEIKKFLKVNFPKYTMKKIFYPLCTNCLKMDDVDIKRVYNGRISFKCNNCNTIASESWKTVKGKFSWKIDLAIRWNIFKIDFEPYSKAYLDPDVGSYFIAKKLSEKFFGKYASEIIPYGQIIMDKSLSFKLLESFPKDLFDAFLTQNRKRDMELSDSKIMQFAQKYKIDKNLTFYEYITTKLQYDLFEQMHGRTKHPEYHKYMNHGVAFAKHFLKREMYPKYPAKETLNEVSIYTLFKIRKIFQWLITYKMDNTDFAPEELGKALNEFLISNEIYKSKVFPTIRKLMSQEHSIPMSKIFYYAPNTYLYGCLMLINQSLLESKIKRTNKQVSQKNIFRSSVV